MRRTAWLWILPAVLLAGVALGACALRMPGSSHQGPLPPPSAEQERIREGLSAHVEALTGERNLSRRPNALREAADYVAQTLGDHGYEVERQPFDTPAGTAENVVAVLPGTERHEEVVVVGAHYDTARGTPGADDNASGVAVMLEIARLLRDEALPRTVRFVAYANEEPPWFTTEHMGSRHDAARLAAADVEVVGMLSLESLGYWRTEPDTQHYPWPFALLYPDTGDFVGFVGNLRSRRLVKRAVGRFREAEPYPSEGAALPGWITGVDWSDHRSYWEEGVPALMVTDTAVFRNPNYHEPTDTPETLDLERTSRVVTGLLAVVEELAGR